MNQNKYPSHILVDHGVKSTLCQCTCHGHNALDVLQILCCDLLESVKDFYVSQNSRSFPMEKRSGLVPFLKFNDWKRRGERRGENEMVLLRHFVFFCVRPIHV
jgi:hypothetical protein